MKQSGPETKTRVNPLEVAAFVGIIWVGVFIFAITNDNAMMYFFPDFHARTNNLHSKRLAEQARYDEKVKECADAYGSKIHRKTLSAADVYDDSLGCFEHVVTEVVGSKRGMEPVLRDLYRFKSGREYQYGDVRMEITGGSTIKYT